MQKAYYLYLTNQQMQPLLFLLSIAFGMISKHCAKLEGLQVDNLFVYYDREMISVFWLTKYFPSLVTDGTLHLCNS